MKDQHELGLYAIGMRISAALLFLLAAFRTAWPAFAYSIPEDEAKRTYGYVLTYVTFFSCWGALALGLGAPWIVRLLTTPDFYAGAGGRPAARVRVRRLRRVRRRRDVDRTGGAARVELDGHRSRRSCSGSRSTSR